MMEHYGDQMNANWRRMTLQYAKNDVCHFGLQGMLSSCVGGIIYLYVAFCAYGGMITIGNVVRYAGAVQQFIQGMTDLFAGWSRLHPTRKKQVQSMPPGKKLHASGEDYLEAVLVIQKKKGMVRSVDVARYMEVSKPSVCHAVATLKAGGFLTMDEDFFLRLTDIGREVAEQIGRAHV